MGYCPRLLEIIEAGEVPGRDEVPQGWKVVCAWCDTFLRGEPDSRMVSHGICKKCLEEGVRELREAPEPPRTY